jgi:hypothetical protein
MSLAFECDSRACVASRLIAMISAMRVESVSGLTQSLDGDDISSLATLSQVA